MYKWVILRNLQEPSTLTVVSCVISSTMNKQKRTKKWGGHCEETTKQNGSFEHTANSTNNQWSCLRIGDARMYSLHVKTGQTA